MQIHHISCGSFRPPLRGLTQGGPGNPFGRAHYVIHCLLIVLDDRLVLVDTGLGRRDMDKPLGTLGWGMALFGGASTGETASQQIAGMQTSAKLSAGMPVTDIIMTHLDKDHTGGLVDFPEARVHLNGMELEAWRRAPGKAGKQRYCDAHFAHKPEWVKYREFNGDWMGLPATPLEDLPDNILLVQLPGHTLGHCGVAIMTEGGWLLHAGDACYHSAWLKGKRPPLAIQWVERILMQDPGAWKNSREKLIELKESGKVMVFTSHDPEMFRSLSAEQSSERSMRIT